MNECPLGGAAHSGTAWPIGRDLSAELASTLSLTLSGLSRCASDLYFWSSSEVAMVRVHPSLCGTSSMMPQKRNPIALERIRALAGDAAGWPASQLGLLHLASSTDADQQQLKHQESQLLTETRGVFFALLVYALVRRVQGTR